MRTTAGITNFSVSPLLKLPSNTLEEKAITFIKTKKDIDAMKDGILTASQSLNKITIENINLRKQSKIQECTLNVEVGKTLIPIHHNTKLVITDIPGLNEADTSDMYLKFTQKAWDSFDCAILVTDAAQGVNTDEQVHLLQFVKNNVQNAKNIPVIIICNKVDDAEDKMLTALVDEVRSRVEYIFDAADRNTALLKMIKPCRSTNGKTDAPLNYSPAFLTLSAENACVYRSESTLERNELQKLGKTYIDEIGRQGVGKFQRKRLSKEEQYDVVYSAVKDINQYRERLEFSNFDKILKVLEVFIGSSEVQTKLIEKQLNIEAKKLTAKTGFVSKLEILFDRSVVVGMSTI